MSDVRQRRRSRWFVIGLASVGALTCAMFFAAVYFSGNLSNGAPKAFTIPAVSMEPTLRIGDHVFADLSAYQSKDPERGDVVVFKVQQRGSEVDYVKRIVGLPGEQIALVAGVLQINGVPARLEAAPLYQPTAHPDEPAKPALSTAYERLPNGRRYQIIASRTTGSGANAGPFMVPQGHYFMLGDYRDNSMDSRFSIGFVKRSAIRGKFTTIYWSRSLSRIFTSVHGSGSTGR